MELINKLNSEFLQARKDKNTTKINLLSTLKGQVDLEKSKPVNKGVDEDLIVQSAAKSMIKNLKEISAANPESEESVYEILILQDYIPQTLSLEEIEAEVVTLDLKKLPNFGARMGKAVKHFKGRADGNDVKSVIVKLYS